MTKTGTDENVVQEFLASSDEVQIIFCRRKAMITNLRGVRLGAGLCGFVGVHGNALQAGPAIIILALP